MFAILPRKCQVRFLSWSSFYKISHWVRSTLVFLAKKGFKRPFKRVWRLISVKTKERIKIWPCLRHHNRICINSFLDTEQNSYAKQNGVKPVGTKCNLRVQRQTFPHQRNCFVRFDKMKILILVRVEISKWFHSPAISGFVSCRGQWYFLTARGL